MTLKLWFLFFFRRDVNVPVSMFDYLALAFHKKIDSYEKEPKIVLATNINPKIVGGKSQSFFTVVAF